MNYLFSSIANEEFTSVTGGYAILKKYSQIGATCVIFHVLTIKEGVAICGMTLVNKTFSE